MPATPMLFRGEAFASSSPFLYFADHRPEIAKLVGDLLHLRREDDTIARRGRGGALGEHGVDGAVIARDAFVFRFLGDDDDGAADRLLLVNLGRRLHLPSVAKPLMAPPAGEVWRLAWSSEDPCYGALGTPAPDTDDGGWWIPAEAAVLPTPVARADAKPVPRLGYSQEMIP